MPVGSTPRRTPIARALPDVVRDGYRPFEVVTLGAPDAQPLAVPLLKDRGLVDGRAAAYVCRDFTCQAPITTPQALEPLLGMRRERADVAPLWGIG